MADKIQPMFERSLPKAGLQEGAIQPRRVEISNSQIVASVSKRSLMDGFSQGVCGAPAQCVELSTADILVDAALHHGGAGTVGASLRAGIPTLIKPWFGDQFFWYVSPLLHCMNCR